MSDTPLGRFCWYELMTTDVEGAKDFYRPIMGWDAVPFPGDGPPYTVWKNGDNHIGGVMTLPDDLAGRGVPPHWMPYISTPDVDETVKKAKAAGGQVHHEFEIATVGRLAVIADPGGPVFTAYEPSGETPGHDGPPVVGECSWHELISDDWEKSWPFYKEVFGWELTEQMDMGPAGIYQMYGNGGRSLGGMMTRNDEMPPPCWFLYMHVPDVHASVETIERLGGKIHTKPMQVPGDAEKPSFILHGIDPQGAGFALHSGPVEN